MNLTELKLGDYFFKWVCSIIPELDENGKPKEYMPQSGYNNVDDLPLNRYGKGSFCKFKIPNEIEACGVYALQVNDEVKYIGQCEDLSARWNMGYGNISPRNCFVGGQPTNCRLNNLILNALKANNHLNLFFYQTNDYYAVERELIKRYSPEWNIQKPFRQRSVSNLRGCPMSPYKDSIGHSKYETLTEYLQHSKNEFETMTYSELEKILGFRLPYSAYEHRPWWANSGHIQAESWITAGWKVRTVNLGSQLFSKDFPNNKGVKVNVGKTWEIFNRRTNKFESIERDLDWSRCLLYDLFGKWQTYVFS